GGRTIRHHWTHTLFRFVRRALGFKFEIQLLVRAELVGTAYHRLLQMCTRDSVLDEACSLILKDEAQHVDFHAGLVRRLSIAVITVGAQDLERTIQSPIYSCRHRCVDRSSALFKNNRAESLREARRECIPFLKQLSQRAARELNPLTTEITPAG